MYIESYKKLGFSLFLGVWALYFGFQIFNYYYTGNYCDRFSDEVEIATQEEIDAMSLCQDIPYCQIGTISVSPKGDKKYFTCERTKKPGVWKE